MYISTVKSINDDLKRTKKAIISLGCSFVEGQGAIANEIYTTYPWEFPNDHGDPIWQLTKKQTARLKSEYPDTRIIKHEFGQTIKFYRQEQNNAFVNVLCKKYFGGEYTPINLGIRGCGNRATIKELQMYPSLNWQDAEEKIVIFCPTGLERFDFINDQTSDHPNFLAMWPNVNGDHGNNSGKSKLWQGYAESLASSKFYILEQIINFIDLTLWCKYHNASLIVVPAFDSRYSVEMFTHAISTTVKRDSKSGTVIESQDRNVSDNSQKLVKQVPWDNFFKPDGETTFADLFIKREGGNIDNGYYFQYLGKPIQQGWVTPCAHPSVKTHDLFAKLLHDEIMLNGSKYSITKD